MHIADLQTDKAVLAELGKRLREARLARNVSQSALAQEAGMARFTLQRIEEGQSSSTTNLIKLLRALPPSYSTPMAPPPSDALVPCRDGRARACPPCPTDPWVILADLRVGRDCSVRGVDCLAHRRYVISYGSYYRICAPMFSPSREDPRATLNEYRMQSLATGSAAMVDLAASASTSPRATVQLTRADGSAATLPASFTVDAGSTIGAVLDAYGERQLYDPVTDRSYTLRALYSAAKIPPGTRVDSTAAAIGLLEGRTISIMTPSGGSASTPPETSVGGLPDLGALHDLIDSSGMELIASEHAGDVSHAVALPATTLIGVSERSALGKAVREMTISDVAESEREAFVSRVTRGIAKRQQPRATKQAEELWDTAMRVAKVAKR